MELSAVSEVFLHARRQLCYWHAIKYLETRLAEDKPPAKYDPQIAHVKFDFINLTWAPGITSGWLEDGVHKSDAECDKPDDEEVHEDHQLVRCLEFKINSVLTLTLQRCKRNLQLVSHLFSC
jgi:hypothetical protein